MKNTQQGFTLIEIVIAITLLAFLSIFTAQSLQRAIRSKFKVQKEINKSSQVRDALTIIAKDIQMAFNYRDINIDLYNEAQKEREKRDKTKKPTQGAGATPATTKKKPFKPKEHVILTHFIGEADSLHFTTLNNVRSIQNSQVSNQAEVGYFLKDCRERLNKKNSSQCLWRRLSSIIDDDVTKDGDEMVLIENVKNFTLRYLGPGHEEEWLAQWKSKDGDEDTKNKFPYAVEISLEILNKNIEKDKPFAMTMLAPVRFPNNPKEQDENEETTQPTSTGASP